MRYFLFALAALIICSCNEDNPINLEKKYWLIDINDGGLVTTSDGETDVKSHIRMVVRGTFEGATPEGTWDLSIDQYTYMDLTENVQDEHILEGYYSGKNYYTNANIDIKQHEVGIPSLTDKTSLFFYSDDRTMPYFLSSPGEYYYKVQGDDGRIEEFRGEQLFLTSYPETMRMHLSGLESNNLSTVEIVFKMLTESGLTSSSLKVYGSIYVFDTNAALNDWMDQHPLVDYLEDPKTIPFQ
jgi:hypothetical protein